MDSRDWMILKVLHEYKNITKTARHLYMSQPALTNRLQHIEQEFGVRIVERNRRGVIFTPEGEFLAKCADEMLLKQRQIQEQVLNMNREVVGTLRLGVVNSFTRNQLPPLLKQFKDLYPNVEFKVITGWSREVYQSLCNHEVH
jgi:DNA-binding transcriptional LysR family regulator